MRTLYLNNSGSRWKNFYTSLECGLNKAETYTWWTKSGKQIHRTIKYWQSWGNFAIACISYKGKIIKVFPNTILED